MTDNKNNGVDILSIDAKDIYISNNYIKQNSIGYNIRYKDGSINTKKFINTLDYSLDLIKLREVYEKVYRKIDFSFKQGKHEYTTRVINVTFKYSNKEFNKIKKDIYVKFGYDINDLIFKDNVCIIDNLLVGVQINSLVEKAISDELLGKYFYYDDGVYKAKENIKSINTKANLRKHLYENGFYCDGIKYVRFKRSSGSSRVGKCLFIDEKLYNKMHKWEMCGIDIKEGQETDLAALEAYISLTLSSIIDTIEINPNNILIIDDYESKFNDDVVVTTLDGKWLKSYPDNVEIKNSIWDGQSLMDKSLFGEYDNYGMLLLRNRFFKSCCFNTNIQKWFADNNITDVKQLNGLTLADKIEDIKLITTPSSIKYIKFGKLIDWLQLTEPMFGVVKHEKPTHFFDGKMVQTHYQLLNTLQLSKEEMDNFLKPTLNYLNLLKNDACVLRHNIKYPEEIEFETSPINSKNDIVYKMIGINSKFTNTKLYYDFKHDLIKSFIKNIRSGHVLVSGNYSTLLGNPIEMLLHSINKFNGVSQLGAGNIHSIRFKYNTTLIGSRSPHVTVGNIWLPKNVKNEVIDLYVNLTNEIVCINSINENVLERLSSADMDSDTSLLSDDQILINAALRNYNLFKVPTSLVEAKKTKRKYTNTEKFDLDVKTSVNKIGEIINLSQELNTKLWDKLNNGSSFEDVAELYYDIAKLDVMSCIEIDKAKKEFIVDNIAEMKKIRKKYNTTDDDGRMIKPNFFGYLARNKGYYNSKKKNYKKHDTSMDYLQKLLNQFQLNRKNKKDKSFIKFHEIFDKSKYSSKYIKYQQVKRIVTLIRDLNEKRKVIYSDDTYDSKTKYTMLAEKKQELIEYIGNIKLSNSTMYYLLTLIEKPEYSDISKLIFNTLFGYPNTDFYKLIEENIEKLPVLIEDSKGEITIYNQKYTKKY